MMEEDNEKQSACMILHLLIQYNIILDLNKRQSLWKFKKKRECSVKNKNKQYNTTQNTK